MFHGAINIYSFFMWGTICFTGMGSFFNFLPSPNLALIEFTQTVFFEKSQNVAKC